MNSIKNKLKMFLVFVLFVLAILFSTSSITGCFAKDDHSKEKQNDKKETNDKKEKKQDHEHKEGDGHDH